MTVKSICMYIALVIFSVFITGCASEFTNFTPTSGDICTEVTIMREGGHRFGTHIVEFNGVRSLDIRLGPRSESNVIAVVPPGATTGPVTIRQNSGMGMFIGMLDSDTYELGNFTVTGSPAVPNITSFNAVPEEIDEGEASTLQWSITGTTTHLELNSPESETIDVTGATSYTVAPTHTTNYRLTAVNKCVTETDSVTVLVNETQASPEIEDVDAGFPGESVTVHGNNLRYRPRDDRPYVESSLIFAQGGTSYSPVVDSSPRDRELNGDLPEAINPGAATVRARVGTLESEPFDFAVAGRENGSFQNVTLQITGSHTCTSGSIVRTLEISGDGEERTANFEEGGSRLWRESFHLGTSNTGAGFSGDCMHGVIVGQNTSVTDNKFVMHVRDLAAGRTRVSETSLGQGVQVLFSPDDSVVLYKAQDDFRGVGFAVIHLYDMRDHSVMPDPGPGNSCTACNSLSARVVNYRDVEITFDGDDYGPYHIE